MKINKPVSFVLGILLIGFGILIFLETHSWHGFIPALIGASLVYVGLRSGRTATIMFGHVLVAVGCFLVTWGLTLLPYTKPIYPTSCSGLFSGDSFQYLAGSARSVMDSATVDSIRRRYNRYDLK